MVFNIKGILKTLNRKKPVDASFQSPLHRCLVFTDLLLLGIGGSVDVALYVVLGNVIRDIAGPAVLISMPLGFIVCFGSALCYAEFASYIPSSGSDYDYVYTSLGEIFGFFDGWSVLVASVIATAALAQGAADLLSSLTDSITFENIDAHVFLPKHVLLAPNLNIVALLIVTLVTIITAIGVHGSIRFNDCIVVINLLVVAFTVILGLFHLNFDYWSSWDKFAPYGVSGILKSLPFTVFFYGGFISVTFSTEEVINPSSIMPKSIVFSIISIFVAFLLVGIVQCLVIPYDKLPLASPLSDAFGLVSFKASKYIIAFGGFCSCLSSVLTACYANSRLSYVMSRDGLLVKFLGKVNKHTLVPVYAVVTTGIIAAVLAAFADLTILVELCSILVVLPYILLCYSVITIRYKENALLEEVPSYEHLPFHNVTTNYEVPKTTDSDEQITQLPREDLTENGILADVTGSDEQLPLQVRSVTADAEVQVPKTTDSDESVTGLPCEIFTESGFMADIPGSDEHLPVHTVNTDSVAPKSTELPSKIFTEGRVKFKIKVALGLLVVSSSCLSIVVRCAVSYNIHSTLFGVLVALSTIPLVISVLVILKTPYTKLHFPYTIPFFPILPLVCLAMTLFVMLQFSLWAWLLFCGNAIFGFIIYFCYGMNHSQVQRTCTMPTTDTIIMNTEL